MSTCFVDRKLSPFILTEPFLFLSNDVVSKTIFPSVQSTLARVYETLNSTNGLFCTRGLIFMSVASSKCASCGLMSHLTSLCTCAMSVLPRCKLLLIRLFLIAAIPYSSERLFYFLKQHPCCFIYHGILIERT